LKLAEGMLTCAPSCRIMQKITAREASRELCGNRQYLVALYEILKFLTTSFYKIWLAAA
jgi:hypothetical protein